jgi:ribosome-associated protein
LKGKAYRPHRKPQRQLDRSGWKPGRHRLAELLDLVREAALDKKGEDFIAIDVGARTILADVFVLVTGRSKIQTRALADSVVEAVELGGHRVAHVEGYTDGNWVLIDLGTIVVHIFTPEQRAFYNLERLWADAPSRQAQSS